MAGDWIKMEHATLDKPEVLRAAEMLGMSRDACIGLFFRYWVWLDRNLSGSCPESVRNLSGSCPDVVRHVSRKSLDDVLQCAGFAAVLEAIGWAKFDEDEWTLQVVNAARHNGNTAKTRAWDARRKAEKRLDSVRVLSGSEPDRMRTREEKRRVLKELPPISPNDTEPKNETTNPENAAALKTAGFPEPPDWLPADVWKSFREHRARLRAPMTANAGRLMLGELERMRKRGHSPAALLNEAMVRGWKAPVDPEDRDRPGGAKRVPAGRLPF